MIRHLLLLSSLLLLSTSMHAYDWGKKGHRVTGVIAEKYLTKKTKKALNELLDGQSLAFVSTYGDEIKSDERYKEFGPWHYVNIPFNSTYEEHPKSDRGDIITGINTCVAVLQDVNESKDAKAFYLRLLVHFIGDLHQPLHVGLADDRGGNDFQVRWYDEGTNIHTVWDTKMIESYDMSYTELAENADRLTKEELELLQSGSVIDWMEDSRKLVKDIYRNTQEGDKLGYRYMYDYFNILRGQLQKGGVRLAHLLNELLG